MKQFFWALILLLNPSIAQTETPKQTAHGAEVPKVNAGKFGLPLEDSRLPIDEAEQNKTYLLPGLDNLIGNIIEYYASYEDDERPAPQDREAMSIALFDGAEDARVKKYSHELLCRILPSSDCRQEENAIGINASGAAASNTSSKLPEDFVWRYLDDLMYLEDITAMLAFWGSLVGVGRHSTCTYLVDTVIGDKREWEKAGGSSATSLMALLPTFLAFGSL